MIKLPWKKILTREYTFLYADYAMAALKIMERTVGTTLELDLFHGQGPLLTIYRVETDIQRSYDLIEAIANAGEDEITKRADRFAELIEQTRELMHVIAEVKDRKSILPLLLKLDQTFLETLCYYLFFVFLGYAGDRPSVAKWLTAHQKQFSELRNSGIDADMNREFPRLFGKFDRQLQTWGALMRRREIKSVLAGKPVDWQRIRQRKQEYLLWYSHGRATEYPLQKIAGVLDRELQHLRSDLQTSTLIGRIAQRGLATGPARIIFTENDYHKIQRGDVIVTPMTKPSIEPHLGKVVGIVTNDGGALSHASIIARERKLPCLVATTHATDVFKDGDQLRLDANQGTVKRLN